MLTTLDKILIGALASIVLINVAFQIYTRLPEDDDQGEVILTVFYGDETWQYTLPELSTIDQYSGTGSMMTQIGIKGPYNFTGARFDVLRQKLGIDRDPLGAQVVAVDGYNRTFTSDDLQGHVDVFDQSGNMSESTVTLLLVYNQDGTPLDRDDGPLRVAYVGQDTCITCITESSYWVKQVTEIRFFPEP